MMARVFPNRENASRRRPEFYGFRRAISDQLVESRAWSLGEIPQLAFFWRSVAPWTPRCVAHTFVGEIWISTGPI